MDAEAQYTVLDFYQLEINSTVASNSSGPPVYRPFSRNSLIYKEMIFVKQRGGRVSRFAGDRVRSMLCKRESRWSGADPGAAACENDAGKDDGVPRRRIGQTTSLLAFTARVQLSR